MNIKVGQEVKGLFESPGGTFGRKKRNIICGTVTKVEDDLFTVQYGGFTYSYTERNIGKIVFINQQQEDTEAQGSRERRWDD